MGSLNPRLHLGLWCLLNFTSEYELAVRSGMVELEFNLVNWCESTVFVEMVCGTLAVLADAF